jgi:uncharacterized protein YdbL (DUF1318 family)
MRRERRLLRSAALLLAALLSLAAPASAGPLDDAKAAGQIGEGLDGYLHLVEGSGPADVKALVQDVNGKRKAKYQSIATQRGAPLPEVAALAGAKLVERTPGGQYVRDASGSWKKK